MSVSISNTLAWKFKPKRDGVSGWGGWMEGGRGRPEPQFFVVEGTGASSLSFSSVVWKSAGLSLALGPGLQ